MGDDIVRVAGDIHPLEEPNLYYVALTRGRKHVYVDMMDETLVKKCGGGNKDTLSNLKK